VTDEQKAEEPVTEAASEKLKGLGIPRDAAMVCMRLDCLVIFEGSEKCPRCGHQAETFSETNAMVYEAIAAEIEPDPFSKRKVLTRRIQ
jgi:hypothetical protein